MNADANASANVGIYPTILRGREGRMNGQIIQYLALNGPSLIYSVAMHLASISQTKVHYPTVNRRMHELLKKQYVQKAGTRTTKAGIPADLYATTIRGDFAALAGMPDSNGENATELSPKEIHQIIANASFRKGSPFVLFARILEQGQIGADLVNRELVPKLIEGVRNGFLNLDALDEGVICSAFSSLVAQKAASIMTDSSQDHSPKSKDMRHQYVGVLMGSLEKMMASNYAGKEKKLQAKINSGTLKEDGRQKSQLTPISLQWGNELKVFLRLHSVKFD